MSLTNEAASAPQGASPSYLAVGIAGLLIISVLAGAAVVVTESGTLTSGYVAIPISLYGQGAEEISGLRFDIAYDPAQFELVEVMAGDSVVDAGKETILVDLPDGRSRVLIMGFNQEAIGDGVVATLYLKPLTPAAREAGPTLEDLSASDPFGYAIDLECENIALQGPKDDTGQDPQSQASSAAPQANEPTPAASRSTETSPSANTLTAAGLGAPDTSDSADRAPSTSTRSARAVGTRTRAPVSRDKFFRSSGAEQRVGYQRRHPRPWPVARARRTTPGETEQYPANLPTTTNASSGKMLAAGPGAVSAGAQLDDSLFGASDELHVEGSLRHLAFSLGTLALLSAVFAAGWLVRRQGWLERRRP